MCVVEAWQHRATVRVDHGGLGAAQALDFAVGADAENLIAADGNGLGERRGAAGVHAAVGDDEIDQSALVIALRADDEAGDESPGYDQNHDERREPRRHVSSLQRWTSHRVCASFGRPDLSTQYDARTGLNARWGSLATHRDRLGCV